MAQKHPQEYAASRMSKMLANRSISERERECSAYLAQGWNPFQKQRDQWRGGCVMEQIVREYSGWSHYVGAQMATLVPLVQKMLAQRTHTDLQTLQSVYEQCLEHGNTQVLGVLLQAGFPVHGIDAKCRGWRPKENPLDPSVDLACTSVDAEHPIYNVKNPNMLAFLHEHGAAIGATNEHACMWLRLAAYQCYSSGFSQATWDELETFIPKYVPQKIPKSLQLIGYRMMYYGQKGLLTRLMQTDGWQRTFDVQGAQDLNASLAAHVWCAQENSQPQADKSQWHQTIPRLNEQGYKAFVTVAALGTEVSERQAQKAFEEVVIERRHMRQIMNVLTGSERPYAVDMLVQLHGVKRLYDWINHPKGQDWGLEITRAQYIGKNKVSEDLINALADQDHVGTINRLKSHGLCAPIVWERYIQHQMDHEKRSDFNPYLIEQILTDVRTYKEYKRGKSLDACVMVNPDDWSCMDVQVDEHKKRLQQAFMQAVLLGMVVQNGTLSTAFWEQAKNALFDDVNEPIDVPLAMWVIRAQPVGLKEKVNNIKSISDNSCCVSMSLVQLLNCAQESDFFAPSSQIKSADELKSQWEKKALKKATAHVLDGMGKALVRPKKEKRLRL